MERVYLKCSNHGDSIKGIQTAPIQLQNYDAVSMTLIQRWILNWNWMNGMYSQSAYVFSLRFIRDFMNRSSLWLHWFDSLHLSLILIYFMEHILEYGSNLFAAHKRQTDALSINIFQLMHTIRVQCAWNMLINIRLALSSFGCFPS